MSRRVLLVGDGTAPTGFARVNEVLARALAGDGWEVHWLMINVTGDPIPAHKLYHVYPASLGGRDLVGIQRIAEVVVASQPDLVVMHGDAWTIGAYLHELRVLEARPPLIGYVPPDSPNQPYGPAINDLTHLLCPSQFGIDALRIGGYTGAASVLPYGVDRDLFHPLDRRASRRALGLPEDAVILGRGDRNAKRKRYDETLRIFADFIKGGAYPEVFLHLHCAPVDTGWDLPQLCRYYGLKGRVFFTAQDLVPSKLVAMERLPQIFSAWDAHWSCTMGEGFGLIALESAACGAAQILPRWSAYAEWMRDGALFVEPGRVLATDGGINSMGCLVDEEDCRTILADFVDDAASRAHWSQKALTVASQPCYDWAVISAAFLRVAEEVVECRKD